MVKAALALALVWAAPCSGWGAETAAQGVSPSGAAFSAQAHGPSPSAGTRDGVHDLPLLPPRPKPAEHQKNVAWEDFTVVTLISAPFTVLWCGLGAALISAASNGRLPLSTSSPLLIGAACTAAAASVSIGLVSVSWGPAAQRPVVPEADAGAKIQVAKP